MKGQLYSKHDTKVQHTSIFFLTTFSITNHYTVNLFIEKLQKVNFSNHKQCSGIGAADTDFLNNLMKIINETATSK